MITNLNENYLQTYEFAEPASTQTTGFWIGSDSRSRGSVLFEFYIRFWRCQFYFGSLPSKMWVLIRLVRFGLGSGPISSLRCCLALGVPRRAQGPRDAARDFRV